MGIIKNILGQRFGRLVVLSFKYKDKNNGAYWECKCDCGNITTVYGGHLRKGSIKSCNCLRKERVTQTQFKNLSGKKYGRLTAIRVAYNDNGMYFWECLCECGKIAIVKSAKLTNGHNRSCGCLCRDIASKRMKIFAKTQRKETHPMWNPNLTQEDRQNKRNNKKWDKWKLKVFTRDNYICKKCGYSNGHILNAHHIYSWNINKRLRYSTNNGITLCNICHKKFHGIFGYGNNTLKQLNKFLK